MRKAFGFLLVPRLVRYSIHVFKSEKAVYDFHMIDVNGYYSRLVAGFVRVSDIICITGLSSGI